MSENKPKLAFWFRYSAADHAELFHALPACMKGLANTCEVHYISPKAVQPVPQQILDNVIMHTLPYSVDRTNNRDKLIKSILWVFCLPFIALYCRFKRIDVIYIDETIPLSATIARIFFGKKIAITVVDFFVDIYLTKRKSFLAKIIKTVDLWSWKKIGLIFTRAKSTKNYLVGQGINPTNIIPIYDPCDMNMYHRMDKIKAKVKWGYTDKELVLVHHGILHPNKGNDRIIKALAEMKDSYPMLRYLLIGDGTEMNNLRQLIAELELEDICNLPGWLPEPSDVSEALNAGDIGLVMRVGEPSDDFHMTGALVHNMACGLPILTARLGGVQEVVEEGRNGLLFDPGNMDEFKEKLIRFAENPELRNTCADAAERDALNYFDMNSVIEQTVTALSRFAHLNY